MILCIPGRMLENHHLMPFTRKLKIVAELAGLLAYPHLIAFPYAGDIQWHEELSNLDTLMVSRGITATGIAPELHRLPF